MAVDLFTELRSLGYYGTTIQMTEQMRRDTTGRRYLGLELNTVIDAAAARSLLELDVSVTESAVTIDTIYTSLEEALLATPVNGTLVIRGVYTRSTTFIVDKSVTILGAGGSITCTVATVCPITVTANNVKIDGVTIVGSGSGAISTAFGIKAIGTLAAQIDGLHITNCDISALSHSGIRIHHCTNFTITKNNIHDIAYSGVMMLSCVGGEVASNRIKDMVMPTGTLAYGIAMTRDSATDIATISPRSKGINCVDNVVTNVPWEGIDTHGGQDLTVSRNKVYHCKYGISIVSCPDTLGDDVYAPLDVTVTNNTVDYQDSVSLGAGIRFVGGGAPSAITEYGTGIISNNTVLGHGLDESLHEGAITLYKTKGLIVSGNRMVEPVMAGISAYYENQSLILSDNTVQDVWSAATDSYAVRFTSYDNDVTVSGTKIIRGTKTAASVNATGLWIKLVSTRNIVSDSGGNTWGNATVHAVDGDPNYNTLPWSSDLPDAAIAHTCERTGTFTAGAIVSGTLHLTAIYLRAGQEIASVTYNSGSTALSGTTHAWAALYSKTRVLLASSTDSTSLTWAADARKTFTFAAAATVSATGWHYVGLMIEASQTPTIESLVGNAMIADLNPKRYGSSNTGLTTTPPSTADAIVSSGSTLHYVYVS